MVGSCATVLEPLRLLRADRRLRYASSSIHMFHLKLWIEQK